MRTICIETLLGELEDAENPAAFLEELREWIHEVSPYKMHPVDRIRWVPIDDVVCNDYNPNAVAGVEMNLLHMSISHDGYTQPVVVIWDEERAKYVIVDGFHRYSTMRDNPDVRATTGGMLPVVVLAKGINDRMASTVRHNRARGKHSVAGMGQMVFQMLEQGWEDERICNELGMSPDELLRLKHVTGFSKLFEDVEYRLAWEKRSMVEKRTAHQKANGGSLS